MTLYYGVEDNAQVVNAAKNAVRVFGGGHKAVRLMLEICCAETNFCTYPDKHPSKWGVGPQQFDDIGLVDLQQRARPKHKRMLFKEMRVDLADIKLDDLADDVELSMMLCRMKFLLVPETIPTELPGRARYWKKHWNSEDGDGTAGKYLSRVANFLPGGFSI